MVDAGHAVRRGRSLEKDEFRGTLPDLQGLPEGIHTLPALQNFISGPNQIQTLIFFKCHIF